MGLRIINPLVAEQTSLINGLKVFVDHADFTEGKSMSASLFGNALVQGRVDTDEWGDITATSNSVRFSTDGGVTWSLPFNIINGTTIVALLTALTGEDRLSINALKDLDTIEFPTVFDFIQFNTLATHVFNTGKLYWDPATNSINYDTEYTGVSLNLSNPYIKVKNNTLYTILKGRAVYMTTPDNGLPSVELGSSSALATCSNLGITIMNIPSGGTGYVTKFGTVNGIDTSTFAAGDFIYLATSSGHFVNVEPVYPEYAIKLGMVLSSHLSAGSILVDINLSYDSDVLKQIETLGTGNAVTSVTKTGDKLTFNKDLVFLVAADIEGKVDKVEGSRLITTEEAALIASIKPDVYTIHLPSAATVANRCSGAVEGTDYPTGWVISADTNPIDLKVVHGLNRRVASVTVSYEDGSIHRQLFDNAAYSGIFTSDVNTLIIESLATITSPINVYIVFA